MSLKSDQMTCISSIDVLKGTVKPVQNGYSTIDKTKNLMTNGSIMKAECIAGFLQYF